MFGCRATFRTKVDNVQHSGDIQNIDVENQTITLFKVTLVETGKVFDSLQKFHHSEIYDLEIDEDTVNVGLKEACLKRETHRNEVKKEKSVVRVKDIPKHLQKLVHLDPAALEMRQMVDKEIERTTDENGVYESTLPASCTLLTDCKSQLFKDAIDHLKACHTVGVSFEGIRLGRDGVLCWILVSTAEHTMFFDVKTMGSGCFDAGIKDILQSHKILKVIHDCRLPSDILHHQYGTKLVNILDTQVAAVYVYKMRHNNDYPRYVMSLPDCLQMYLWMDREDLYFPLVRAHCPEKDEEVYALRPEPSLVYQWMHQRCHFLLALRDREMDEILLEFTMGVDHYLQSVRDASKSDAKMRQASQHLLPREFNGLEVELNAVLRDRNLKKRRTPLKYVAMANRDTQGMHENCKGISHPRVIASHDTIWHNAYYPKSSGGPSKVKTDGGAPGSQSRRRQQRCSSDTEIREDGSPRTLALKHAHSSGTKSSADYSSGPDEGGSNPRTLFTGASASGSPGSHQFHNNTGNKADSVPSSGDDTVSPGEKSKARMKQMLENRRRLVNGDIPGLSESEDANTDDGGLQACAAITRSSGNDSAEEKTDPELEKRERTMALLHQITKEQQEKEKNGAAADALRYSFRPAGGEVRLNISRRKQRDMRAHKEVDPEDMGSKSTGICHEATKLDGNEFDAIPYQKTLREKYRPNESSTASGSSLLVPTPDPVSSINGFKIDSFAKTVPPPLYAGSSPKPDRTTARRQALEAILPQVENHALMLEGSRSNPVRKLLSSSESTVESDSCLLVDLDIKAREGSEAATSGLTLNGGVEKTLSASPVCGNVHANSNAVLSHNAAALKNLPSQETVSNPSFWTSKSSAGANNHHMPLHSVKNATAAHLQTVKNTVVSDVVSTPRGQNSIRTVLDLTPSLNSSLGAQNSAVSSASQSSPACTGALQSVTSPGKTSPAVYSKPGGKSVMAMLGFTLTPQERMMRNAEAAKSSSSG
ncbi:streptococcal hemagglutinin-like [Littorina saxatilis]